LSFSYYFASNFCENAKMICCLRETREGWPLLAVEIEATGIYGEQMTGGPFFVGSLIFYPALAALVSPVQNISFPHRTLF
jgi:hypothetical protein